MPYILEKMTMDDIEKVAAYAALNPRQSYWNLTGTRGMFTCLKNDLNKVSGDPDLSEERRDQVMQGLMPDWAIDRERNYYLFRRPYLPDCHYYLFFFKGTLYPVSVNKLREEDVVGKVKSPFVSLDLRKEFQEEFTEACRIYNLGHPVNFTANSFAANPNGERNARP